MTDDTEPQPVIPSLIREDGSSFARDIAGVAAALAALGNEERKAYRDSNAASVAAHTADRILVVAGPGSGKSFLFLARVQHWLPLHPEAQVYVASFVRKLVADLRSDVDNSRDLADADRRRVTVTTLHQLARSLLERNGGTAAQPLAKHIRVIAPPWDVVVLEDALLFENDLGNSDFTPRRLQRQFHTEEFDPDPGWMRLRARYFELGRFYNAVGFADMIVLARQAIEQNPDLNEHLLWIVDEYQDFNAAEDHLVRAITDSARGVLIAGDDEQALYQGLKASHPEIIISYYDDGAFANAMLPYCSRCGYHACLVASAFMAVHRAAAAIDKIYLPLKVDPGEPKVQVVGTSTPSGAVHYIRRFLQDRKAELDDYVVKLESGEETDPFLLILSPDREAKFFRFKNADDELRSLVAEWTGVGPGHSFDYRRVATYCAAGWDASDNFALRKVLYFEGVMPEDVHELIARAIAEGRRLSAVDSHVVRDAMAKCKQVAGVIESEELGPLEQASRLATVVAVDDPERLASEMAVDPIGKGRVSAEDELELVHPTGGSTVQPVEFMTMVGAKGLSAQHVILIGCDDVNLNSVSPLTFFVALTRARQSLHLITALQARGTGPHKFVGDLPEDHCDYSWYKKAGSGTWEPLGSRAGFAAKFGQLARIAARLKKR